MLQFFLSSIKGLISVLSAAKSSAPVTHHGTSVLISDLQDRGQPRHDHEAHTRKTQTYNSQHFQERKLSEPLSHLKQHDVSSSRNR